MDPYGIHMSHTCPGLARILIIQWVTPLGWLCVTSQVSHGGCVWWENRKVYKKKKRLYIRDIAGKRCNGKRQTVRRARCGPSCAVTPQSIFPCRALSHSVTFIQHSLLFTTISFFLLAFLHFFFLPFCFCGFHAVCSRFLLLYLCATSLSLHSLCSLISPLSPPPPS